MALKAILETIEGLAEDIVAHYKEKTIDGVKKFYLDVTGVDGLALEDVTALKTTITTLRKSEKTLRKDVDTGEDALRKHEAKFEGVDPKAAKEAIGKMEEMANWNGDEKIADASKVATEKAEAAAQVRIDKIAADNNEKVTGLDAKLKSSQAQLHEAIVETKIRQAIGDLEGNAGLLYPHVLAQVKMVESDNGKFAPQVLNAAGDQRYKDEVAGTFMNINDLVTEMRDNETYAPCFKGTGSSGAGKRGSGDGDGNKKPASKDKKVKHIKHDDAAAVSENLEGIANGSVVVDMPNTDLDN